MSEAMNATDAVNVLMFLRRQAETEPGTPESKAMCLRVAAHLADQVKRFNRPVDDGGPAFAVLPPLGPDGTAAVGYPYVSAGMTLRDYFAALAMQALINPKGEDFDRVAEVPEYAYQIADAMLKARQA